MQRRHFIFSLCLLSLAAACRRSPTLTSLPAGSIVLAFGDSVTYGTGAARTEDWPTLLAAQTGWSIINAGIPGDTAEAGKNRLAALLAEHKPALVLLEIGGNDFLRRRAQSAVKEDIRQMLTSIRASGAQAVLVAVPELSLFGAITRRASDASLYAELGKEERVLVISDVFAEILSKPEWCADQIHPNAQGYRQMADGILAALKKFGLISR